jgi:hypothetical protein
MFLCPLAEPVIHAWTTAVACSSFGPPTHETHYCAGQGTEEKQDDDDDDNKEEEGMTYEEKEKMR